MRDWKDTLNLPRTDFPMKANLPATEPATIARWDAMGLYARLARRAPRAPDVRAARRPAVRQRRRSTSATRSTRSSRTSSSSRGRWPASTRRTCPGWDCHGLPIELNVERELGAAAKDRAPAEFRRACRAFADKFVDSQREDFKRLGILGDWDHAVPHDDAGLPGGDRARARQVRRARSRLQGQEAGALVPARSHGARRGRSRVRDAHVAVDLRRVPALGGRRRARSARGCPRSPAATSRCSSGRRRRGRSRRTWRSRSIRTSTTARTSGERASERASSSSPRRSPGSVAADDRAAARPPSSRRSRARALEGVRVPASALRPRLARRARATTSRSSRARARCTPRPDTAPTTSRPACGTASTSTRRSARNGRFTADVGIVGGLKVFEANPVVEAALAERGRLWFRTERRPFVSALLALPSAGDLPGDVAVVHQHGRPARGGASPRRTPCSGSRRGAASG